MTTRTRAQKTRKKPAAKTTPTAAPAPIPTPQPALPLRERRPFITEPQIAAAFAASLAGVPYTRITGWLPHNDGTVRYALPSGAALTYNPSAKTPLTAWTPCDHGTRHPHAVATPTDLQQARAEAATCTSSHATPPVRTLAAALNDDTQTLDVADLRAAHDEPKDHPHG